MNQFSNRFTVIYGFIILCALGLVLQAARIQVFGSKFKNSASKYAIDKQTQYPSRGLIYDRNGQLLVYNIPVYDLKVTYNKVPKEIDTTLFCKLLNIRKDSFSILITKDWRSAQFSKSVPFTFYSKISPERFAKFQEHLHLFPGFYPVLRYIRSYPHQNAAHALGYLGEVNQKVIDNNTGYSSGDFMGVSGLEKTYENKLKGQKGYNYLLKDNLGREVGAYSEGGLDSVAQSGLDLITGLDLELQKYGESLMNGKRGSVVAIEPSSGEILSIISAPSYDPNLLALNQNRGSSFKRLFQDSINRPFLDRSVMAKYPPGSIFKPIFSLIALQDEITYASRTIYCDGEYTVNKKRGFSQGCHGHPTPYNISIALEHSCNSYYYQLLREYVEQYGYSQPGKGLDRLKSRLADFGLGIPLGIDSYLENKGNVPGSKYFDRLYANVRSGWRSTYILSLGIGQGELQLTTVQMANLAAIIANRGHYFIPHLVKSYSASDSLIAKKYNTPNYVNVDSVHFKPVIKGMYDVIRSGTAQMAYVPGLDICGKTGTSQNPHGEDHSVFFAFAPKENPKIAIAVYVENAGFGGTIAAPIASLMIEKYLNREIGLSSKWKEDFIYSKNLIETPDQ